MENMATIILSSTVISAIITTIVSVFINKRKDTIENIIKERKNWRDDLRVISLEISKSKNLKELKHIIGKLKVRINPYGFAKEDIFYDTFIWKQINVLENCNKMKKGELEKCKNKYINLISCLLKFDWERSKNEIKGSIQTKFVIVSLIICHLFYSIKWICDFGFEKEKNMDYISYCVVYTIFIAFALITINLMDKWKNARQLYFYIGIGFIGTLLYILLWNNIVSYSFTMIDIILLIIPIITLLYSAETKMLIYKRNMKLYILASMAATGITKINKKYIIFFNRNEKLPSGEEIKFED